MTDPEICGGVKGYYYEYTIGKSTLCTLLRKLILCKSLELMKNYVWTNYNLDSFYLRRYYLSTLSIYIAFELVNRRLV